MHFLVLSVPSPFDLCRRVGGADMGGGAGGASGWYEAMDVSGARG